MRYRGRQLWRRLAFPWGRGRGGSAGEPDGHGVRGALRTGRARSKGADPQRAAAAGLGTGEGRRSLAVAGRWRRIVGASVKLRLWPIVQARTFRAPEVSPEVPNVPGVWNSSMAIECIHGNTAKTWHQLKTRIGSPLAGALALLGFPSCPRYQPLAHQQPGGGHGG